MAGQIPKNLIGPAQALTSSVAAYASTGSGSTFGIIRTIFAMPSAGSPTLTVALGADAAGTRIIPALQLTNGVPYVMNGWIITPTNNAHAIDASSTATGTQLIANISGYEYS
jgi:hypothetical protein